MIQRRLKKINWILLNPLLYNKIFPTIPALLVEGEFVSHFRTKANLVDIFLLQYAH